MNTPFIVGIGFSLFCLYFLKFSLSSFKKAKESESWPTTQGRMTKVKLWGKRSVDGVHQDAENLSVIYEYTINDISYTSHIVAFYTQVYPETFKFAQDNPVESSITVYYNSINSSESVLISGLGDKPYSGLILSTMGIIAGISVTISAWLGKIG